jgi:hypothetical protein
MTAPLQPRKIGSALARVAVQEINLLVAAVIGPNSSVVANPRTSRRRRPAV